MFANEVLNGLSAHPKTLSSKWFYDTEGDELFRAIMAMPEYYLTDSEREIFQSAAPELLDALDHEPFDLIELGAGDGSKTQLLIEQFLAAGIHFSYRPIDISANALVILGELINRRWPRLPFAPLRGDYFDALNRLGKRAEDRRRLILFPGGNIGNFLPEEALEFLTRLKHFLRPGDFLLTGFDLKKDPAIILNAYNDAAGHTAAFNLNLLARINRELGGDFVLENWRHWETYDPVSGAARSFLVAKEACSVTIADIDAVFTFGPAEAITVEISQKYSREEIQRLANTAGFELVKNLEDQKGWFADSLWRVPG